MIGPTRPADRTEDPLSRTDRVDALPCNLCGRGEHEVLYAPGVAQRSQIVRCSGCGLMYASPRAKQPDVAEIVTWDPDFDVFTQPLMKIRYDKERLQIRDYRSSRREMARTFPDRGRLLEVGASFGYGLREWSRDGWDVVGVEPWKYGARFATERLGLTVHADILRNVAFEAESFDVVVMLHVIEHVPDPVAELAEVFRILKPGGRFICETPTYDSLMFKLLGRRERSISCDGHIYFFTAETLGAAGRKCGFEVERVRRVGRSLTAQRFVDNIGIMSKASWLRSAVQGTARTLRFHKIPLYLNLRDMVRVTFAKPEGSAPRSGAS